MKDQSTKVISFPSPVPSKADYQRVKSSYSIKEIKQLFGLSEKTIRRWTEQGIIQASPSSQAPDFVYDFHALTQFRRVRELRAQGHSIRQIEAELQGQLNLFRVETPRLARLLTPFEEALLLARARRRKRRRALPGSDQRRRQRRRSLLQPRHHQSRARPDSPTRSTTLRFH